MSWLSPVTYSENLPNAGRQFHIDFAKFFAAIGLVACHVYERFIMMETYTEPTPFPSLAGFFELFSSGAVLFMFCLGIGLIYSHRNSAKHMLVRSRTMIISAFSLSFFTNGLSLFILSVINNSPEMLNDALGWLFCCDIVNFACLVFLFFALVRKLHLSNLVVLLIAVVLLIVSTFVPSNLFSDNIVLQDLTGWFFWQENGFSFFPFAQWLIFPVCGYLFGQLLIQTKNILKFYRNVTIISGAGLGIYIGILLLAGVDIIQFTSLYNGLVYDITVVSVIWHLLFWSFILCLIFWLSLLVKPKSRLQKIATSTSAMLTLIYIIQWIIIGFVYYWIFPPLGVMPVNLPTAIVSVIIIFLASYFIAKGYRHLKKKRANAKNNRNIS